MIKIRPAQKQPSCDLSRGEGDDSFDRKAAFLRQSVKIEPLVDRWYAWPHLLAPAQQALNLTFRYLPLLESFLSDPEEHLRAALDPQFYGGPFVALPPSGKSQIKRYLRRTRSRRAKAIEFAKQYRALASRLQAEADGANLAQLRPPRESLLDGFIEPVYDLGNNAKIRLLEEAFVFEDLEHSSAQQLFLHMLPDEQRPFFMATPRIGWPDSLCVDVQFRSDASARLHSARNDPIDLDAFARDIDVPVRAIEPFFTRYPSKNGAPKFEGPGVRVRHFGHACLVVETPSACVVIDPMACFDEREDKLGFSDLPEKVDFVVVSHGHQDHFSPEILLALRDRVNRFLIPPSNRGEPADPSLKSILLQLGIEAIQTLDVLDTVAVGDMKITSLPFTGEHCDLDIHSKQCVLIETDDFKICIFIDTDAIDIALYEKFMHILVDADLVFIGMECFGAPLTWLYGPLLSQAVSREYDESRRLSGADENKAWRLIKQIRPKAVFVYAMGQLPWIRHLMGLEYQENSIQILESNRFLKKCVDHQIVSELLDESKEILLQ